MEQPPIMKPAPGPGPEYDPMDLIVQEVQNVQSFLDHLEMEPKNLPYLKTHLTPILNLQSSLFDHLEMLGFDPYNYSESRLKGLHQLLELLFKVVRDAAKAMDPWNAEDFKTCLKEAEKLLSKFDGDLTL